MNGFVMMGRGLESLLRTNFFKIAGFPDVAPSRTNFPCGAILPGYEILSAW
jgi:hypothetical protein